MAATSAGAGLGSPATATTAASRFLAAYDGACLLAIRFDTEDVLTQALPAAVTAHVLVDPEAGGIARTTGNVHALAVRAAVRTERGLVLAGRCGEEAGVQEVELLALCEPEHFAATERVRRRGDCASMDRSLREAIASVVQDDAAAFAPATMGAYLVAGVSGLQEARRQRWRQSAPLP